METTATGSDDQLAIDTPENVAFGYDIAGLGSRFLAALIDTLIITGLQLLALLVMLAVLANIGSQLTDDNLAWIVGGYVLLSFVFLWGYYILFETIWAGSTPGKRVLKLRVIRRDGTPIALTEAVVRNLIRFADFLPAYYGLGVVTIFADRQSRRLGDMAAGTLVVRERATVSLASLIATDTPSSDPAPDAPRLLGNDLYLASEFMRRRHDLTNRQALGLQIANRLAASRGETPPDDPEAYLQRLLS